MHIGLVSCAARKLKIRCPAKYMYMMSSRYALLYQMAEQKCDEVWIISGKHGILPSSRVIDPYEQKITPEKVKEVLQALKLLLTTHTFEAWLGGNYAGVLEGTGIINHLQGKSIFMFAASTPGNLRMKKFDWPMWDVLYNAIGRNTLEIREYLKSKKYAPSTVMAQLARVENCPLLQKDENKRYHNIYETEKDILETEKEILNEGFFL